MVISCIAGTINILNWNVTKRGAFFGHKKKFIYCFIKLLWQQKTKNKKVLVCCELFDLPRIKHRDEAKRKNSRMPKNCKYGIIRKCKVTRKFVAERVFECARRSTPVPTLDMVASTRSGWISWARNDHF